MKPEVERQLLLYRDILLSNNPNAPPVKTEGWYTENSTRYTALGESVMEKALEAWEATQPTDVPLEATPGQSSCGGFCDWKAWCPHWWNWRLENGTLGTEDFSDSVILLHHFDDRNGSGIAEICEPANAEGRAMPQVYRFQLISMVGEKRLCKSYLQPVIKVQFLSGAL